GGPTPWHPTTGVTGLAFTQGYLGFSRSGKVAALRISGGGAHVTVGFHRPDGHVSAAAVIHMVKYGSGRNVPWEVVGTDDTTLTLDVPAYGGVATSPVRIGGEVTRGGERPPAPGPPPRPPPPPAPFSPPPPPPPTPPPPP